MEQETTFEEALAELENIVKNLESGQTKLDDAVISYEKAVKLKNFCQDRLKQAELKIEKLSIASDGSVCKTPFESDQQ